MAPFKISEPPQKKQVAAFWGRSLQDADSFCYRHKRLPDNRPQATHRATRALAQSQQGPAHWTPAKTTAEDAEVWNVKSLEFQIPPLLAYHDIPQPSAA